MRDRDQEHGNAIEQAVRAALRRGLHDLGEILPYCDGAQPDEVAPILRRLLREPAPQEQGKTAERKGIIRDQSRHRFRSELAELYRMLPAPNPELAQWWFDIDTIETITDTMGKFNDQDARTLCIGAPTVAMGLVVGGRPATVLDVDEDLLKSLTTISGKQGRGSLTAMFFDVRGGDISKVLNGTRFDQVLVDPPWYRNWFGAFLASGVEALASVGDLFCTLLPRLTRPSAEVDRADVITSLSESGLRVLSVDRGCLQYVVPRFEEQAYKDLSGYTGVQWRRGDLLHARREDSGEISEGAFGPLLADPLDGREIQSYHRKPTKFRVFLWERFQDRTSPPVVPVEILDNYMTTVSKRGESEVPDVWSSEKEGLALQSPEVAKAVREALKAWAAGTDKQGTIKEIAAHRSAEEIVDCLDEGLGLWGRFEALPDADQHGEEPATGPLLRDRSRVFATEEDPYRNPFSRDRDRLVWSTSLRKLANKTQVFPAAEDDFLRQRLAHSIEVMQLATTIGRALGLNLELIEAGALAHDIGHTPFGHAGEHAIHFVLASIHDRLFFNHYEHGVDVVRFLEGPYQHHPGHPGLDLTRGTVDCIFKHIYFHRKDKKGGGSCKGTLRGAGVPGPPNSLVEMHSRSKHRDYLDVGRCHPEGQAVRLADKMSYLLSDVEDGIRLGAIGMDELRRCRLFHRPPIDLVRREAESLQAVFVRERRNILKVLMEDAIEASALRWSRSRREELPEDHYIVDHSAPIRSDVEQVWTNLQAGRLHRSPAVRLANVHAAQVVSQLVVGLSLMPDLVDASYREAHDRLLRSPGGAEYLGYYREVVGAREVIIPEKLRSFLPLERTIGEATARAQKGSVSIQDLVLAKDYVASLSDSGAERLQERLVG